MFIDQPKHKILVKFNTNGVRVSIFLMLVLSSVVTLSLIS
jgi:hypothetical protein